MYSRNSFGSYYPVNSTIHRLNAVVKLINFVLAIILIFATSSTTIIMFLLTFVIIMMLLSYVPIRYYFNTFYSLRYLYLLIAFICAFSGVNFEGYLVIIAKIVIFCEYLNIIAFTTSPSENIYAIEKILSPFNIFYLNVSKIAFRIDSLLRYLPLYMTVKYKLVKSSSSRGVIYKRLGLFKKIRFSSNVRRLTRLKNEEILNESELRLFDIKKKRTNLSVYKVGFYDIIFLLFHLVLLFAYVIDEGLI